MAARARSKLWIDPHKIAEHGQYIFIYTSNRYNQVIYSLSRVLKNHRALKQLPFLGKHTKPGALRKDAWRPLATVRFPSGVQGLAAYKQLLEFRKRHELEWTDAEMDEAATHLRKERELSVDDRKEIDRRHLEKSLEKRATALARKPTKSKGKPPMAGRPYWKDPSQLWTRTRRERAQIVMMTSKANCIADLAAVLHYQDIAAQAAAQQQADLQQKTQTALAGAQSRLEEIARLKPSLWAEGTDESLKQFKALKREKMKLLRAMAKPDPYAAINGQYSWLNDPREPSKRGPGRIRRHRETRILSMNGVAVEWANFLDAQYASSWPQTVLHKLLPPTGQGRRLRNVLTTVLQPPNAPKLIESGKAGLEEPLDNQPEILPPHAAPSGKPPSGPSSRPPPSPSMMDRLLHRLKYGATT